MRFRVWAPDAARVEVETAGGRHAMRAAGDGWWEAVVAAAGPGADYAFRLDGEGPFPDPRSPWQPRGVHAASRALDLRGHRWHDAGWSAPPLAEGVVYELHVGTFSPEGTFDGVASRLDHLLDLGVTHLELMPVASFPGERGWGYDGVTPWAPHPAYGGPRGLARLVDACHRRGLAVLLDVVYNHLGPEGNHLARYGPYFTDRYRTPWGEAVNLDGPGSDEVRRYVLDNARWWLERYHLDGLRLDAVHALHDESALHLLEELSAEVAALAERLGRRLELVAESDRNDPRPLWPRPAGYGLDALWSDDFHHALHAVLTGERGGYYADFGRLADVATALTEGFVYAGRRSAFRGRRHGRPAAGVPGGRLVGYLQNHDQVGNRARGERLAHLAGPARQRVGAALVLTSPFVPLLFQGEEWAASSPFLFFTDHGDAELAAAVSEGRRREFAGFGWAPEDVPDPQAEETFRRSRLAWDELGREPHAGMLDWYRRLVALRRSRRELSDGRRGEVATACDEAAGWLTVRRGGVAVAVDLGGEPRRVPLPATPVEVLLASPPDPTLAGDAVLLAPDSVAVLALAVG